MSISRSRAVANCRAFAVTAAATAVLVTAVFAANASATATAAMSADTSATASYSVRPTTLSCSASAGQSPVAQVQGGAEAPLCVREHWVYDLPASPSPATVRRTETHWGSTTTPKAFTEGQTVTYEAEYLGELGRAGQQDYDWHVLWQLQGPIGTTWGPPAMGLNVRNGQVRLGGGSGHPNHSWTGKNYEWSYNVGQWQDNTPVRVKVQTFLSSDPNRGWVSAWVNGRQVLNQILPTSYKGALRPGTYYPGQSYVVSRTGLYRGSQGSEVPTYRQVMTAQVISAG